jgi:hypothetical protein
MNYEDFLKIFEDQKGILFTGAGFSKLAKNIIDGELPTGGAFSETLCDLIGIDKDADLQFTSAEFIERKDIFQLIEILKNSFTVNADSCNMYNKISVYPWERIYTTNYDNTMEVCSAKHGKKITPVTILDIPSNYREKNNLCIHLNGYIDRLTPESLDKEFRLTTDSFMWNDYNDEKWLKLFRQDVKYCDFILFIGFNILNDIDIRRSISAVSENKKKIFFIAREKLSDNEKLKLEKIGTVYTVGIEKFLCDFEKIKVRNINAMGNIKLFAIEEKKQNDGIVTQVKDKDVFDLLFYGRVDDKLILQTLKDEDSFYYFDRVDINKSIEYLKKPGAALVLHSNIANGKSLAASIVMQHFILNNYRVFCLEKIDENALKDIKTISSLIGNKLIVIENYNSFFRLFDDISDIFTDQSIKFIFTERSLINDYAEDKLREYFHNIKSLDLNQISYDDFNALNKYFDKYGFWGEFAKYHEDKRKQLVFETCNANISLILLKIINSANTRSRLLGIFKTISQSSTLFEILLLIALKDIFNFSMSHEEIEYILGESFSNKFKFNKSDEINELIEFNRNNIKVKSIVLSDLIMTCIENPGVLINLLMKLVIYSNKQGNDWYYNDILKKTSNYGLLTRLFKNFDQKQRLIISYYEQIKDFKSFEKNPLFWLQYAMSMVAISEYSRAKLYFSTAYSFAEKKPWFDSFQIDNQFARFLLENEIEIGTKETCMIAFKEAHNILIRSSDSFHYTFKVAINYYNFYRKYYTEITISEKKYLDLACITMHDKAKKYQASIPEYRHSKYVNEFIKKMLELNIKK